MPIDENYEIDRYHFSPPNALCASGSLEDALQLTNLSGAKYAPLSLVRKIRGSETRVIPNFFCIFQQDPETQSLDRALSSNAIFSQHPYEKQKPNKPYLKLLNLPNTPENVRLRQEAVKELAQNNELFEYIGTALRKSKLYQIDQVTLEDLGKRGNRSDMVVDCHISPENMNDFIATLKGTRDFSPQSQALERLARWAEELESDTLYSELIREKRKTTDARVVAIYSERHGGMRYGLLKPGVDPTEVFDFLDTSVAEHQVQKMYRGDVKRDRRLCVKHQRPEDEKLIDLAVGHARQRMDILNEVTSQMLALPGYLAQTQLTQIYHGAYLAKRLEQRGYPVCFPEIRDDQGHIEVQGLLPMRLVLDVLRSGDDKRYAANDFTLTRKQNVIQARGPNKKGKSEAWRAINLLTNLTNAGFPSACTSAQTSVFPASYFISFKGDRAFGGSELEHSLRQASNELSQVCPGSIVILDELGDCTNSPTAQKYASRLIPLLRKRKCKVFITSQHDALSEYIDDFLGGTSFMPNPNGKREQRFKLVPASTSIDFEPEKSLDGMGMTRASINRTIPITSTQPARKIPPGNFVDDHTDNPEFDTPF